MSCRWLRLFRYCLCCLIQHAKNDRNSNHIAFSWYAGCSGKAIGEAKKTLQKCRAGCLLLGGRCAVRRWCCCAGWLLTVAVAAASTMQDNAAQAAGPFAVAPWVTLNTRWWIQMTSEVRIQNALMDRSNMLDAWTYGLTCLFQKSSEENDGKSESRIRAWIFVELFMQESDQLSTNDSFLIVWLTVGDSFWIEIVIEIVIAFVMQTFDQVNITIASTWQIDPHSLCVSTHRSTLVNIYIYIYTHLFYSMVGFSYL